MNEVVADELQAFKAAFFRALAHPVRIRILEVLSKGEMSVQELQEVLGVDQPVVSQQLAVLRSTNVVSGRKGAMFLTVEVTGVPAHSGGAHDKGVSAIEELCRKVIALHALTDWRTTLNVARASGYFDAKQAEVVREFLDAPDLWSRAHGGV